MRRLLTPALVVLLVLGVLPGPVLAATPVADPIVATTDEDTPVEVTLQATDADGDALVFQVTTPPVEGGLGTLSSPACDAGVCTAQVTYTPDEDSNGPDAFAYTVTDGDTTSEAASVSIDVTPVNDAPTFGVGADPTVAEDAGPQSVAGFITAAAPGPVTALDEAGQAISYTLDAADASLFSAQPAVDAAGDLTFTPAQDAFGSTTVSITATDDGTPPADSGAAGFTITVTPVNDDPSFTPGASVQVAKGSGPYVQAGWAGAISPGPGESDGVAFTVTPLDGSLFATAPAIDSSGQLTFTPGTTTGSTSVEVTLADDATPTPGTSAPETFTITITDGPAAIAGAVQVVEDSVANPITLSGTDPEDDTLAFAVVDQPANGTLSGDAPDLLYTPDPDYFGPDSVTFTVADGETVSPEATVTITVTPVNDPVDARFDVVAVKATVTTTLSVLQANGGVADSAGPGEPLDDLTITGVTTPAKGSVRISQDGKTVSYDPSRCSTGSDKFDYTVSDGEFSDTATVVVTINRPGQGGNSTSPITDTPTSTFVTNSTMGTTVPVKLSWCGVTTSTTSVRSYKLQQSTSSGLTYPTTLYTATTSGSTTRNLSTSTNYRWRVRTVDSAGRTGSYRQSLATRITRYQDTNSAITYAGTWGPATAGSPSGGTQRYTTQAGASASITVTNRERFAIVGAKSSSRGSFRVYVDGVLVATVSAKTSSSTVSYRRVLYHRPLTSGTGNSHVIRIEAVGNGRIDLDTILTLGAP